MPCGGAAPRDMGVKSVPRQRLGTLWPDGGRPVMQERPRGLSRLFQFTMRVKLAVRVVEPEVPVTVTV